MGVLLGKFAKTDINKLSNSTQNDNLTSLLTTNNGKSPVNQARPHFFGSRKNVPVHIKVDDQTFNSSNEGWNFEDEYKFYIQKSIKKKSGSNNVSYKRKLRKICKELSGHPHHCLACDVLMDKIQTSPKISKRDISRMNGTLSLDRPHGIALDMCIQIDHNKSLKIQNTNEAKIRTRSRSNSTYNGNNKKLKNLQLRQLSSEPVVVLDETIVFEYLKAKRTIDRIMRPDKIKRNFEENC